MDPVAAPEPPAAPDVTLTAAAAPRSRTARHEPVAAAAEPSLAGRLFAVMKREPVLFISAAYILVSFMGLWSGYWFYRGLGLPILDYLQGGDLFIAGLRRPDYALMLGAALLVLWLSSLPMAWAERHPERARAFRERHRWGALVLPEQRGWMGLWGVRTDTLLVFTFLALSLHLLRVHGTVRAQGIVAGTAGNAAQDVRLTLAGADAPLPGTARLLGTTSAFVLVWWPQAGRVEALPVANISRIESAAAAAPVAAPASEPVPPPPPVPAKAAR